MLSVDSVTEKYSRRATDKTLSADEVKAATLIVKAEKLVDDEDDAGALETAQEALALCKQVKDKAGIADSARICTHVLVFKEERKQAAQLVKENLAFFEEVNDKSGKAKMLLALAEVNCDRRGNAKRAEGLEQATEALDLFRELGDKKMEASTLLTLGAIHIKRKSDKMGGATDAFNCSTESLKIARDTNDRKAEASALHAFAVCSIQLALLDPSLCLRTLFYDPTFEDGFDASKEALRLWRELGCKSAESYELQCLAQWQLVAGHAEEALPDAETSAQIDCKGHKASSMAVHVQALLANGQNDQALKIAQETLDDCRNRGDTNGEISALNMLVSAYRATGKLQQAYDAGEEVLEHIRDKEDTINEMRMQNTLAQIQLERKEYSGCMDCADEMLRIAEELEDSKNQAVARHWIAEVHREKGDPAKYLAEVKKQQRLFKSASDEKGEALALLDECDARFQKADFDDALEAAVKSQNIYKDHGDKTGEAQALSMIVDVQQMLNDGEAVLKASARQRSLLKSIGDKKGEAAAALTTCYARLYHLQESGLKRDSQEYEEVWGRAFREAKDGMTLASSIGEESLFARSFYMLAEVYVATSGKGEEAFQCATQAVKLYKEEGDTKGEASAQVTLGHAQHLLGKRAEAVEAAQAAQALFQQLGDEAGVSTAQQALMQFSGAMQFQQWQQGDWSQYQDAGAAGAPADAGAPAAAGGSSAAVAKPKLKPEDVADIITKAVQNVTFMDDDIDGDQPLMQAGLTSNTVVLLRNELAQTFTDKNMPFTLVFDFPCVNAITDFILD